MVQSKSTRTGKTETKTRATASTGKAASAKAKAGSPKSKVTDEDIRKRAYEIYVARGGAHGSEMDDWLKAKVELNKEKGK
jgi:hypothetical protein